MATGRRSARAQSYEAIFSLGRAEFRRRDGEIDTTSRSASPEDDIELRRVSLTNPSRTARTIELTSFAEVVLSQARRGRGALSPSATCSCRPS